ncbi:MAG: ribonuclease P protein component [Clostridia bacterium]|nr:ribonuclease P protein component [Clostridia bacterium]
MKYKAIGENHLYQKAYRRGIKAVTDTVVVYCLRDFAAKRLQKEHPEKKKINRIGLTVTKKIGGAVTRSRVKRILREGFRLLDTEKKIKKGYLIVLVARDAAVRAKTQQIRGDLAYAFRRLGMYEGEPAPQFAVPKAKRKPDAAPSDRTKTGE